MTTLANSTEKESQSIPHFLLVGLKEHYCSCAALVELQKTQGEALDEVSHDGY